MTPFFASICLSTALLALGVSAGPVGTDDQIYPSLDYGTFMTPSPYVRPRFRYWPNDASVNLSRVAEDVKDAGRVGAGGIELLGYYLYGDTASYGGANMAPLQSDWTVYGFGLPAWKTLMDTVLNAAQEENLLVDLSVGPDQGAGIAAPYDDDGLLWDLAAYNVSVPVGSSFDAVLPGWGSGPLVAATTALLVNVSNYTTTSIITGSSTVTDYTLSGSSLTDITDQVASSGHVTIDFSSDAQGSEYLVFAFYLKHSEFREVNSQLDVPTAVPQSPVQTWEQNASWVVDHFSAEGAKLITDFWAENLLSGNTSDLIRQVGNYMWEDSQEFGAGVTLFWTPNLPQTFASNRGYSLNQYIPLFLGVEGTASYSFVTDDADAGAAYVEDYEQTLTELNQIYLTTLTNWSNSLGVQWSSQVVYNLPLDMLANVPLANGPECETLGFNHNIDGYRQFSGPANLAGKRIISSEAGAIMGSVYQQTIPELLWDLKRSIAGGVNQYIIHGYPYSGNYGNTTWPGFTTFNYQFSEMHGRHQPAWSFYSDWLDWLSRSQFIAQSGAPKLDVAFYQKLTSYKDVDTQYWSDDLLTAGYTYEYLSPDNFNLPEAYVSNATFAPDRQAFKAMVVRGNSSLTVTGVNKLVQYAHQGLPIIFYGGLPTNISGHNTSLATSVAGTLNSVTSLPNVHTVSYGSLASTLASLEILPRAAVNANGSWYTYWRQDDQTSTDYVFVYNDATDIPIGQGMTAGNVSFESTGTPFIYDAWTGNVTAIHSYQQTANHTIIPLQLAGNQSIIIGFQKNTSPGLHVACDAPLITTDQGAADSFTVLRTYDPSSQSVALSNGKTIDLQPMLSNALTLSDWTVVVESWTPPANPYDLESPPTQTNTTFNNLHSLLPWSQLSSSLTNVSGLGYYSASFSWPPSTTDSSSSCSSSSTTNSTLVSGALIDLGPIIHTARVSVNGIALPPLDLTWAKADIGAYLQNGVNTVEVVVSTPLGNALRQVWNETYTSGRSASKSATVPSQAQYGLIGEVVVVPYREDVVVG